MSNLDLLHGGDPALMAGLDELIGLVHGRHTFAGWKFGNFMDDEPVTVSEREPVTGAATVAGIHGPRRARTTPTVRTGMKGGHSE